MTLQSKHSLSDWKALTLMLESGASTLDEYTVYKACCAFAINGNRHDAESILNFPYDLLLRARRNVKLSKYTEAEEQLTELDQLSKTHERYFEIAGDIASVRAHIAHRRQDVPAATTFFLLAVSLHSKGQDLHRSLRSLINHRILTADLNSHISGELFFLKQKAHAEGFADLVANIEKSAANDWLMVGNFIQAKASAQAAVDSYKLDGCPEDRSIAFSLLALSHYLLNDYTQGDSIFNQMTILDGKVASYVAILNSVSNRKLPQIPKGHPLAGLDWKKNLPAEVPIPKPNSVSGRILSALRDGDKERDALITEIWNQAVYSEAYCARLYTAINELKRKYKIQIRFDGQRYSLLEDKAS